MVTEIIRMLLKSKLRDERIKRNMKTSFTSLSLFWCRRKRERIVHIHTRIEIDFYFIEVNYYYWSNFFFKNCPFYKRHVEKEKLVHHKIIPRISRPIVHFSYECGGKKRIKIFMNSKFNFW